MGYSLLSCLYISGEIESDCMEQQFHHYFYIQRVCVCVLPLHSANVNIFCSTQTCTFLFLELVFLLIHDATHRFFTPLGAGSVALQNKKKILKITFGIFFECCQQSHCTQCDFGSIHFTATLQRERSSAAGEEICLSAPVKVEIL